jgi:hypothetical protein
LFGFDTAVIAGVATALREFFRSRPPISERRFRCAAGHIARSDIVGERGDRHGSRNILRVVGLLYVISALGCSLAWSFTSFVSCRLLVGIAVGGSSALAAIFPEKIAPSHLPTWCRCIHRGIFLDAGNARRGIGTSERAASHGRDKSLALQYVMPRTTSIRVRRLTTKKIFNR